MAEEAFLPYQFRGSGYRIELRVYQFDAIARRPELMPKFRMVTIGGSNPREVDLIFDHNCNIRVRRRTARRRPLALRATAPPRSKQKQASSYATTSKTRWTSTSFLVAIVRQSSRIESLKTTSGGLGHFFKLGACRVGGW